MIKNIKERLEEKICYKGGGFKSIGKSISKGFKKTQKPFKEIHKKLGTDRLVGNLTGGLIGTSDAERAQKRAMEEAKEQARREAEMYEKQVAEENKRRIEEAQRAADEARRAREEQAKAIRDAEEKRKAEDAFTRQVSQDSGTLTKATNNALTNNTTAGTTVDYSGAVNSDLTKKDDEDIDKLKKAFKYKL